MGLVSKRVSWVLDADIRGFFDTISHEWMLKFLEHRIGDRRVLRLVAKWLRAGVLEDGKWSATQVGTPQGSVISPLLANVHLHYAFDLWVAQWRKSSASGDVIVVRYADDFVLGFQYRASAVRFLAELKERMHKFGLALHPDKTRLIEFGRFAAHHRLRKGEGKPESFDFLGFTHSCGVTLTNKKFTVRRQTVAKRMRAKLHEIRQALYERRHDPVPEQGVWLGAVVRGYMNYYAVPGNIMMMEAFRRECVRHWLHALRRRSQRHRMTWERFAPLADLWVPKPKILHPYPNQRFDARTKGKSPVQ
jgi:group II intron reverse transcriptase/maturase